MSEENNKIARHVAGQIYDSSDIEYNAKLILDAINKAPDTKIVDWLEKNFDSITGYESPKSKSFRDWIKDFMADHERVKAAMNR